MQGKEHEKGNDMYVLVCVLIGILAFGIGFVFGGGYCVNLYNKDPDRFDAMYWRKEDWE